MLASHLDHTASGLPCAEICALRGAAACQAASTRHLPQRALDRDPGPHERGQSPRGRHPPHHHQMVTYPATGTVDGSHPQVHVGREPPWAASTPG
jgi:hypothetical protein